MHLRASNKLQAARPAPAGAVLPVARPASRRAARLQPVAAVVSDFNTKVWPDAAVGAACIGLSRGFSPRSGIRSV